MEEKLEFRARKCNYDQMRPLTVSLIDGRKMEMISAAPIRANKGSPSPDTLVMVHNVCIIKSWLVHPAVGEESVTLTWSEVCGWSWILRNKHVRGRSTRARGDDTPRPGERDASLVYLDFCQELEGNMPTTGSLHLCGIHLGLLKRNPFYNRKQWASCSQL